jgi:PTS system glucose-specific IIC component
MAANPAEWRFPAYLGFFAGKRFVPIATAFVAIAMGFALAIIWSPIQNAINALGNWAVTQNTAVGVWIYGTVERALLPFGLHHIWNAFWFFQIGSYTTPSGEVVNGLTICAVYDVQTRHPLRRLPVQDVRPG